MKNLDLNGKSLEDLQGLASQYKTLRQDLKNQNFFFFRDQKFVGESYRSYFESNVKVIKVIDDCLDEIKHALDGGLQ